MLYENQRLSSLESLPAELLEAIAGYLDIKELTSLRVASIECLSKTKQTFKHLFTSFGVLLCDYEALATLLDIAKHPVFGRVIRHLFIYTDECCEFINHRMMVPMFREEKGTNFDSTHFVCRLEQRGMRRDDLDSINLELALSQLAVHNKLTSMTVLCHHTSSSAISHSLPPQPLLSKRLLGLNRHADFHSPGSDLCPSTSQRRMKVIIEAVNASGLVIENLNLAATTSPRETEIFGTPEIYSLFCKIVYPLKKLRLDVSSYTSYDTNNQPDEFSYACVENILHAIQQAPNLQDLHISSSGGENCPLLSKLIHTHLPLLECLTLANGLMEVEDLLQLVATKPNLRRLELHDWHNFDEEDRIREDETVQAAFVRMTGIEEVVTDGDTEAILECQKENMLEESDDDEQ
ncbi:Putative F-box domain, leucine-rich repeat domain superfamily [Septoria linicola]|uniref:F-box domain, leucine-rich repeat domain superfamily n=1 Tax=Septoria linicola TaxID=215465 RepID=A0A9Q9EIU6_9PEZI|nr:Putative F-box domain, leucine-rich repeat domain superfamily [Septoria linicola]